MTSQFSGFYCRTIVAEQILSISQKLNELGYDANRQTLHELGPRHLSLTIIKRPTYTQTNTLLIFTEVTFILNLNIIM